MIGLELEHDTEVLMVGSVIVKKQIVLLDCCDRGTEEQEPQYFDFLAMQNNCLPSRQMTRLSDTCVLVCIIVVMGSKG